MTIATTTDGKTTCGSTEVVVGEAALPITGAIPEAEAVTGVSARVPLAVTRAVRGKERVRGVVRGKEKARIGLKRKDLKIMES